MSTAVTEAAQRLLLRLVGGEPRERDLEQQASVEQLVQADRLVSSIIAIASLRLRPMPCCAVWATKMPLPGPWSRGSGCGSRAASAPREASGG